MSERRKLNRTLRQAYLIDAMGGGRCSKHGAYFGFGKHGLRACPFCDIDAYYKPKKRAQKRKKKRRKR